MKKKKKGVKPTLVQYPMRMFLWHANSGNIWGYSRDGVDNGGGSADGVGVDEDEDDDRDDDDDDDDDGDDDDDYNDDSRWWSDGWCHSWPRLSLSRRERVTNRRHIFSTFTSTNKNDSSDKHKQQQQQHHHYHHHHHQQHHIRWIALVEGLFKAKQKKIIYLAKSIDP